MIKKLAAWGRLLLRWESKHSKIAQLLDRVAQQLIYVEKLGVRVLAGNVSHTHDIRLVELC